LKDELAEVYAEFLKRLDEEEKRWQGFLVLLKGMPSEIEKTMRMLRNLCYPCACKIEYLSIEKVEEVKKCLRREK